MPGNFTLGFTPATPLDSSKKPAKAPAEKPAEKKPADPSIWSKENCSKDVPVGKGNVKEHEYRGGQEFCRIRPLEG